MRVEIQYAAPCPACGVSLNCTGCKDKAEEITKLREQVAAQDEEIARLEKQVEYHKAYAEEAMSEFNGLMETKKAQAAVIEKLRTFVQHVAKQIPEKPDYWSSCGQCSSNSSEAEDLLEIPTDNTQILDEVRRAERERCAKVCDRLSRKEKDHAAGYGFGYLTYTADDCAAAIRAME